MSYSLQTAVWQNGPTDPTMKFVLLSLAERADDNGYCWPSHADTAKRTGYAKRTIIKIVARLEEDGWIRTEARFDAGRERSSNAFFIDLNRLLGSDRSSLPATQNAAEVVNVDHQVVNYDHPGSELRSPKPIIESINEPEEEDAPAPTTRTPAQVLTDHFRQRTALEPNSRSGTYDRDWLRPLEKFLELSRGDPLAAVDLINRALAVAHGDNEQRKVYTVSCPRSLVGIAANLAATQQARVAGDNADDLWRQALAVVTGTKTGDSRLLTAIRAIGADRIRMARETDVPELKRTLAHGYHRGMAATA